MWKRHRTKTALVCVILASGVLAYFGYSGPPSDRRFLLWCLLGFGAFLLGSLYFAKILHCPRCGADMGKFASLPIFLRLRTVRPRYAECPDCGCVVDRYNDNRPV